MCDGLSDQDDRLSKLEQTLLVRKSCIEKTQATSLELRMKQDRICSKVNLQEKMVRNLNQDILV